MALAILKLIVSSALRTKLTLCMEKYHPFTGYINADAVVVVLILSLLVHQKPFERRAELKQIRGKYKETF